MEIRRLILGCFALAVVSLANAGEDVVSVQTDTVRAEIDLATGTISRLELLLYADGKGGHVELIDGVSSKAELRLVGSAIRGPQRYSAEQTSFEMAEQQDHVEIHLSGTAADPADVHVDKTFVFRRGSYLIDVTEDITNTSSQALSVKASFELVGTPPEDQPLGGSTYNGPSLYTGDGSYRKVPFGDIAKGKGVEGKIAGQGWIAMVRPYFAAAWISPTHNTMEYFTRQIDSHVFGAGVRSDLTGLPPRTSIRIHVQLFAGPQSQKAMDLIAPGFDKILDYGWLSVLTTPLFEVLRVLHSATGNWGWAIVLLTIALRICLYPLSLRSHQAMAKFRRLAPEIERARREAGDDKKALGDRVLSLYDAEGATPGEGLVPLLLQVPIFIALFSVLRGATEMRGAPWIGWISDLSVADPYCVLPVVLGASMLAQAFMSPRPPESWQVAMKWGLPVLMPVAFTLVPAGLILYWSLNNLLMALQQWMLNRVTSDASESLEESSNHANGVPAAQSNKSALLTP